MTSPKNIWLDVDPGHDDAIAILFAVHCPNINLLGISTVHGNAPAECTAVNAARCLLAYGAPNHLRVYPGASKPLLRPAKHDPEIHGPDGLGGVEGLPAVDDPAVLALIAKDEDGQSIYALDGMTAAIKKVKANGEKVSVVSCGPMTNIGLFVALRPELLDAVDQFVFMGGGVGLGNRSAVAEYNIQCDPHAAQIVLDAPVPTVMVPINVTHTAIADRKVMWNLLRPGLPVGSPNDALPTAKTPLRHTLTTLIQFFAGSYKSTFGFEDGPPIHDALTVAYVSNPEIFTSTRYRVDVELEGKWTVGETVVDVWDYQHASPDIWGVGGKNCIVTQAVQVDQFFAMFLDCVDRCDPVCPLK
ncbi:Inosine/uridine-preferring nucleoside hydrolase [Cylindrobasidium torrendii FP15055 ss-10]|uniref:Inosine/uridine-preferring nucleoside hydrolase n=1 Tax=Cylindrobasidium torrendii FP15055 ss-10 TaxID=1314674 RepID=A0A0D7BMM7_9AGAR|nr:Inosine/uridine-preferring nucleoside hydrolase [Cylindrobasidium torrendii FP15055 ss-10]